MANKIELYDGEEFMGEADRLPAGYVWHTCDHADGDMFGVKLGSGCPNRRFGCEFVAPEVQLMWSEALGWVTVPQD